MHPCFFFFLCTTRPGWSFSCHITQPKTSSQDLPGIDFPSLHWCQRDDIRDPCNICGQVLPINTDTTWKYQPCPSCLDAGCSIPPDETCCGQCPLSHSKNTWKTLLIIKLVQKKSLCLVFELLSHTQRSPITNHVTSLRHHTPFIQCDLWPLFSLVPSLDRDHMIKRNGTSLLLAKKVRGVGLFH